VQVARIGAVTFSRMNFSAYVYHMTIFSRTLASCFVVGLGLGLGLDLVSGWLLCTRICDAL